MEKIASLIKEGWSLKFWPSIDLPNYMLVFAWHPKKGSHKFGFSLEFLNEYPNAIIDDFKKFL